jgi:hypothetical protein
VLDCSGTRLLIRDSRNYVTAFSAGILKLYSVSQNVTARIFFKQNSLNEITLLTLTVEFWFRKNLKQKKVPRAKTPGLVNKVKYNAN